MIASRHEIWLLCLVQTCQCLGVSPKKPKQEECVFAHFPHVTSNGLLLQHKWPALAFETSVQPDFWWQGPRRPACLPSSLHQPLLNCRSKYSTLNGKACSCCSEGGSSATPLMSTGAYKAFELFSLICVFHLVWIFFCFQKWFLKWSRQRGDLRDSGICALPGL